MIVAFLTFAFASQSPIDACIGGSERSAIVFCQELSPAIQLELVVLYEQEPTERVAMLLGLQANRAVDLTSLIRAEKDTGRWYWLTGGKASAASPTRTRRLRRWLRDPDDTLSFIASVLEHRGVRVSQRTWRHLAEHATPDVRQVAISKLQVDNVRQVEDGLSAESDEVVRMIWAKLAFKLSEEPASIREQLTSILAWQRYAFDGGTQWGRQWLVEELVITDDPAWLIRTLAEEGPPELWTRCRQVFDTKVRGLDSKIIRDACLAAWKIRSGRQGLSVEEAADLARQAR